MKQKLTTMLLLVALLAVMTGCGNAASGGSASSAASSDSAATETSAEDTDEAADTADDTSSGDTADTNTLTLAVNTGMETLGQLNMEQQNTLAMRLVYEGLVQYKDGEVKPLLAESFEFNDDGTELTFHLRDNVTFHDGTPFTAQVVEKWITMHSGNPANSAFIMSDANLQSAEVIDDSTIKMIFATPYFHYLEDLSYADVMQQVTEEMIDTENAVIVTDNGNYGTGPYKIESLNDEELVLTKYENYWGDLSAYPYDTIVIKTIHDESSRLQALQNGEVDMLYGALFISPEQYHQGIALNGIEGKATDTFSMTLNLTLNCASENLSDVRVREAIEYAIDKESMAEGITYSLAEPADTLFPRDLPMCDHDVTIRKYNVEKANELLDDAGWLMNDSTGIREKDGAPLHLTFTYDSGEAINRQLGIVLQNMLKEVGIDLETSPQDIYVWWGGCVAGDYDVTLWNVSLEPHTVPNRLFISWPICTAHTPSLTGLSDSETCLALIDEFSKTDDTERVTEIFDELFNYSADNVLNIPLMTTRDFVLYRTDKIADYTFPENARFFEAGCVIPAE